MQRHNHVTLWNQHNYPQCKSVEVKGTRLRCLLDSQRAYDMTMAYRYRPHVDFLNLKTDRDLAGFVRRWGPLWVPFNSPVSEVVHDKREYWAIQRQLKALLNLSGALNSKDAPALGAAILEYVNVHDKKESPAIKRKPRRWGFPALSLSLVHTLSHKHDFFANDTALERALKHPREWVPKIPLSELRSVAAQCIESSLAATSQLSVTWRNGRAEVGWKPDALNLQDALRWMLWHDLAGSRPLASCLGCGTAFLPDSEHARKFCSPECAHRVAVREWRKRERRKKRLAERRT
jgi:CGNR zinc finger protein